MWMSGCEMEELSIEAERRSTSVSMKPRRASWGWEVASPVEESQESSTFDRLLSETKADA